MGEGRELFCYQRDIASKFSAWVILTAREDSVGNGQGSSKFLLSKKSSEYPFLHGLHLQLLSLSSAEMVNSRQTR